MGYIGIVIEIVAAVIFIIALFDKKIDKKSRIIMGAISGIILLICIILYGALLLLISAID